MNRLNHHKTQDELQARILDNRLELLESIPLQLLPVEIEPKFITNLPHDQKGKYQRALWLCGLEDSYFFHNHAEDMSGNHMPEHISLYRCAHLADDLIAGFWDIMQMLHNKANPIADQPCVSLV